MALTYEVKIVKPQNVQLPRLRDLGVWTRGRGVLFVCMLFLSVTDASQMTDDFGRTLVCHERISVKDFLLSFPLNANFIMYLHL